MSFPRNGREMDQPPVGGSVKRARELAAAGLPPKERPQGLRLPRTMEEDAPQIAQPSVNPRRPFAGPTGPPPSRPPSRPPRPQAPGGQKAMAGQAGVATSNPPQGSQWPLAGPLPSPVTTSDSDSYGPPAGRPPPRPARPSQVPSKLDGSKIQDPTPAFQYQPEPDREPSTQDRLSVPEMPSSLSRVSDGSSVGSIPEFPVPVQLPILPSRRSVTLGPPPSARRGASSFYSTVSYVSPIPEESPRRSHTSFASSAAIPESWGSQSPGPSPQYPEAFYEDPLAEEGNAYEDEAEESRLVRSASLGKRGKPLLVATATPKDADFEEPSRRPDPVPIQSDAFKNGTGYIDASTSSSGTLPTIRMLAPPPALTRDSFIDAYSAASAMDPSNPQARATPSPQPSSRAYSRLSAIRRPPKLDLGAIRKAEARGSLTSLPDLIRRATRLAASLDEGRRPASRFDDLNYLDSFGADGEKELSDAEKYRSGLSDMLAAFPPPAQASSGRSFRGSFRQHVSSWPVPLMTRGQASGSSLREAIPYDSDSQRKKTKRRCCGLPCWAFLLVMFLVLVLIAAAIVVPVEFFVVRKNDGNQTPASDLQDCQAQLTCQNGGTNVITGGVCSCICTNGFTGSNCSVSAATGCVTTTLTGDTTIKNVTLGDAIPRLIQQAQTNFSIPLSSTALVAKFNSADLSCSAENALVTFDGETTRQGDASEEVTAPSGSTSAIVAREKGPEAMDGIPYTTVTVSGGSMTTVAVPTTSAANQVNARGAVFETTFTGPTTFTVSLVYGPTLTLSQSSTRSTSTKTVTATASVSTASASPSETFTVTEEVLDFARVTVLLIFQEDSLTSAESSQNTLQRLFSTVDQGKTDASKAVSIDAARNVSLSSGYTIDLVDKRVDIGGQLYGTTAS